MEDFELNYIPFHLMINENVSRKSIEEIAKFDFLI